jgi:hypothetical protein
MAAGAGVELSAADGATGVVVELVEGVEASVGDDVTGAVVVPVGVGVGAGAEEGLTAGAVAGLSVGSLGNMPMRWARVKAPPAVITIMMPWLPMPETE